MLHCNGQHQGNINTQRCTKSVQLAGPDSDAHEQCEASPLADMKVQHADVLVTMAIVNRHLQFCGVGCCAEAKPQQLVHFRRVHDAIFDFSFKKQPL